MSDDSLRSIFNNCRTVLFDFDGPLCDVFAGRPAWRIARELERLAGHQVDSDDPLEILRAVYAADRSAGQVIEDALILAETEAVQVSRAEAAGVRALRASAEDGKRVGIVSNNSELAIRLFLDQQYLTDLVSVVVGRAHRRPDWMKPNPWAVLRAIENLEGEPSEAVLIGDSVTDIEAARRAGVKCIAFANKFEKVELFSSYGVPVVTKMSQIWED